MTVRWVFAALHLGMVAGEMTLPHPTAHARLAAYELSSARYRLPLRAGQRAALCAPRPRA